MLISDLLNILFDQSDYSTLIVLGSLHKRKTAYAKKYSVLIHYELNESPDLELIACSLKLIKHYVDNIDDSIDIFDDTEFPLNLCAKRGHIEIVKYLCNPDIDMLWAVNAFIAGACSGHLDVVKFLVSKSSLFFAEDMAPVMASAAGHLNVVEYFVENGVDIHCHNERVLRVALDHSKLHVAKYLVDVVGADIHVLNEKAFVTSVTCNQIDVAKYLIEAGAHIHVINEWLVHDLHCRGLSGMIDLLCSKGCKNAIEFVEKLKVNL